MTLGIERQVFCTCYFVEKYTEMFIEMKTVIRQNSLLTDSSEGQKVCCVGIKTETDKQINIDCCVFSKVT